jgi:hypothetical protein
VLIVTLLYLARQIRVAREQSLLDSFQHIHDHINQFNDSLAQSQDLADLVVSGRASFDKLSSGQQLRFEHVYGRLLNILESWHFQVTKTSLNSEYRKAHLSNIVQVIRHYFRYDGVRKFWAGYRNLYPLDLQELIDGEIHINPATDGGSNLPISGPIDP